MQARTSAAFRHAPEARWIMDRGGARPTGAAPAIVADDSPLPAHPLYRERALALWPRLDSAGLARAKGDPWRIARLVARRTAQPLEVIVAMLTQCPVSAVQPLGTGRSLRVVPGALPRRSPTGD